MRALDGMEPRRQLTSAKVNALNQRAFPRRVRLRGVKSTRIVSQQHRVRLNHSRWRPAIVVQAKSADNAFSDGLGELDSGNHRELGHLAFFAASAE